MGDLSAAEFARKLQMKPQTLHTYLKGRDPSIHFAVNVCRFFGVSSKWLLLGEGEMYEAESSAPTAGIERARLQSIIETCETAAEDLGVVLDPPKKKAELFAMLYEMSVDNQKIDRNIVYGLIKLATL